jgi:hypothetical protein
VGIVASMDAASFASAIAVVPKTPMDTLLS